MFRKRNCFVYMYIQYYGFLKSFDCEGPLDAPWFSMASQAQRFESGDCIFIGFFENSGSRGKKATKREAGANPDLCQPIYVKLSPSLLI